MTQLQLCSFEQSVALKEFGFCWETNACFDELSKMWSTQRIKDESDFYISCPTIQHAFMWLREVKGIECIVNSLYIRKGYEMTLWKLNSTRIPIDDPDGTYTTHPEAESACLDAAIFYLKYQQK